MRRAGGFDRQPRWRLFLIFWAVIAIGGITGQVIASIGVDVYHPGRQFVMPPVWAYPLDLFWAAATAALVVAWRRGRRARESWRRR